MGTNALYTLYGSNIRVANDDGIDIQIGQRFLITKDNELCIYTM